jgi:serine/threonine protein kinase
MDTEMNAAENKCSRCGTKLPAGIDAESCRKCLLEIGLESGTDFSLGNMAETLPHRGEPTANFNAELRYAQSGLKRYRDLQSIHDWSGGTVYRAFHEGLQRFVLLRVLVSSANDDARREFLRRAEKLSHVNHPHIAATLEAGVDHGTTYVAEEWVDASPVDGFQPRSWRQRWAEGFFPNGELMQAMRAAASGLAAIHEAGLTHDRISPDSIVRDKGGNIKLVGLGEASESGDDRFAVPTSIPRATVAADLFQLGATFCFLTTGKVPTDLDPNLDGRVLARRLKQCNRGLRIDMCRLIAGCIARDSHSNIAIQNRATADVENEKAAENPFESAARNDCLLYATAADVVDELNSLLKSGAVRIDWRRRFSSGHSELLCCVFVLAMAYSFIRVPNASTGNGDFDFWIPVMFFVLPIFYVVVLETCLGWTIVRRAFGMRLLDHSGLRAVWWQRLSRALQKSLLLVLLIALPPMIVSILPLSALPSWLTILLLQSLLLFLPALGMYLPSRWIPSRWTTYDLFAGVTWGEETLATAKSLPVGTLAATPSARLTSPTCIVDQYELYESLGSGGMGQVFRGRDRILGRDVAIKLLSGSLVDNPLLLERFQREARLAAKVNHPGVAKVFSNGVWNRTPYIAMELVPGSNLQQRIKEIGPLKLSIAWDYTIQAAEALRAADRSGVVHRDVKPANLMVTDDGKLKVADFGVSRSVSLDRAEDSQEITELSKTEVGTIVGTPAYMAPEQAMGKEVDCRCDMYALGMTLYHMLSGQAPFKAKNTVEMLARQMSDQPASLLGQVHGLTHDQSAVLERMVAKQPADRYASYDELLDALQLHAPGTDRLASPLKRIAAEACNLVVWYLIFFAGVLTAYFGSIVFDTNKVVFRGMFAASHVLVLLAILWMTVIEVGQRGKNIGKRSLGLRVVRVNGERIGYKRAAVRFVVAYPFFAVYFPRALLEVISNTFWRLPNEFYVWYGLQLIVVIVSVIMMWTRSDRRTLHDLAAGTMVIRDKRPHTPAQNVRG